MMMKEMGDDSTKKHPASHAMAWQLLLMALPQTAGYQS
jgi:hypothetical protein